MENAWLKGFWKGFIAGLAIATIIVQVFARFH